MPKRKLNVLTRKEGVREENSLFKVVGDFYEEGAKRTPSDRLKFDTELADPNRAFKIRAKKVAEEMPKPKKGFQKPNYKKQIKKKMLANY